MQVSLGDAYSGERRRLVFQLHVPRPAELGVNKVSDVVLRYTTIGEQIAAHEMQIRSL